MKEHNNCICKDNLLRFYRSHFWATVMLLLLILCEYILLSISYAFTTPCTAVWVPVGIFLISLVIGFCLKVYTFDKWMIKGFLGNSITGGYTAIFFLIVFLITCAFVPALIHDYIADKSLTLWGLFVGIAAIPLEVLIYPSTESFDRCPIEKREILVSPISFTKPKENETDYFGSSKSRNEGFYYPIARCKNLKEIWVVVSKEFIDYTKLCFPNMKDATDKEVVACYVNRIIQETNDNHKEYDIHISEPVEYNDFDNCYEGVKKVFNEIGKDKAKKTIINISPGTAMVGSALAMFAIQGNRMLAYNKQNLPKGINPFSESNANVLSMKELIEEMIIEIQNSRQSKE